jgi:hypothetical protein
MITPLPPEQILDLIVEQARRVGPAPVDATPDEWQAYEWRRGDFGTYTLGVLKAAGLLGETSSSRRCGRRPSSPSTT